MNEIVLSEKKRLVATFSQQPILYCKNISHSISLIKDVFNAPCVQLNELNAECHTVLYSVLVKFIQGMLCFYGRDESDMSSEQVKMVIDEIVRKYYYFRLEDVCLCFKKARAESAYKEFYGRIDGSVILSWFATYDKQRDEVIHSLPNGVAVVNQGGMSRDEWEEIRLAKAAGGDMDAYAAMIASEHRDRWMIANRVKFGNYQYHRKHKYDEKR